MIALQCVDLILGLVTEKSTRSGTYQGSSTAATNASTFESFGLYCSMYLSMHEPPRLSDYSGRGRVLILEFDREPVGLRQESVSRDLSS